VSHQPFDDNPASHAFGVVSDQEAVVQGAGAGAGGGFPLAEEHARALLLDFSADLLGVTGFDGRVRWANPAHEALLGLAPRDLVGQPFEDILHPDDRDPARQALARLVGGDDVTSFEARLRAAGGSYRWFQFSARAHAGLELVYSVGRDVTERRRTEDELALARELALGVAGAESAEAALGMVLRAVCERTGWAIGQAWVRSDDGRTLVCSPAWHATAAGLEPFRRVTEALSFVPGIGLAGKAWELAQPVWIRDVRSEPGFERGHFAEAVGLAGGVAVPVTADEDVVAVIEFFVFEERDEDERLVALVSAVAAQVGALIARKHAEEALRLSEEHFRAVAESAADAIVSVDDTRTVAYVNRAAERIFGRTQEELIGTRIETLLERFPADQFPDGTVVAATGRRPGGARIPLEATFSRWTADGAHYTTAVLRDVTDLRRADAVVREAEERFRGAFEHAPIGMALVSIEQDRAGCLLRVNHALCELLGRASDELIGTMVADIVVPGDGADTDSRYVPWMLAGELPGYEAELRLRRADEGELMALASVSLVRDAQERPLYLILQVQDVTARKQAEAALHESRERVQAIIDNTPAVISVKDTEGRYTLVNRSFEMLFGLERERATGRTDAELFPAELAGSMRANDLRVMREHVPLQVEEVLERADGPHTYLSAKFPLRDPAGEPYAVCAIATDITERKRAEQALRESEQHFRSIVDTAHDAFVSLDESGRITAWNPQAEQMFGWAEREAVGRSFAETLIPARQRNSHMRALRRFMETGKGSLFDERVEWDVVRRDGHEFVVEMTMSAVRARGRYTFNAFLHDISERKQAEEMLRRLAEIVESSHDAIIATTPNGEITSWNPGARDLYGYRVDEALGRSLDLLIPPARADEGSVLAQALAGRRLEDFETEHRRKDGSLVPVSVTVSPMRDSRRAIVGASVIVRDRTERKRAEEAMREVQEAFRRAFEDAPIGMALFGVEADDRGRLLQVNNSMCEITGYASRELSSMRLEEITHPADADVERPLAEGLLSGDIPNYQLEKRYLRGDGRTVWVMHNASIAHDSSGRLLYGIAQVQDITRRKETEDRLSAVAAELERRASELERSNSDLQEFAYVASHDLSEPLRMVSSYVQLLARRYQGQLDSDADDFIGYAVDGVNRMQRLIDDLLAYSRAGTSEYRFGPVEVGALVRDTLVGMQATVTDSGAAVDVGELPEVWGDEGQLRQLFQNLIGNGIKFRRPEEPPRVEVSAERQGRECLFRVSDNGIGIDPRHAERIFSVFKRLHGREEYPGSGIGLSICKRIVERHHGQIWVEPRPAGGTTFAFTIPDRDERRAQADEAGA